MNWDGNEELMEVTQFQCPRFAHLRPLLWRLGCGGALKLMVSVCFSSYPLVMTNVAIEAMTIEIVDFPIKNKVDLSIVMLVITRG